jgi:DNA modification methylase
VTDPPYEIGFMGKGWDDSGIANNPELWKEVLRVLKPGGHLLSFSHSRTYHRQAVAVEDAGFEIRDQIMWIYGSGFPKSHNIGKAVDKIQGNERDVVGSKGSYRDMRGGALDPNLTEGRERLDIMETKGTSQYEGWGTALKPAHEPIVMARKPLSEKTIVKNVLEHGTGGINIDGCRVEGEPWIRDNTKGKSAMYDGWGMKPNIKENKTGGRFPANIIFDEEAGKILDEQSGITKSGGKKPNVKEYNKNRGEFVSNMGETYNSYEPNEGGASRFFYCPKASKKDRNDGCDELEEKGYEVNFKESPKQGSIQKYGMEEALKRLKELKSKNNHPTVKPTDLMAYLVRLVTPKGGTVLDPFMGSGSTGKAAVREGYGTLLV